MNNNKNNLLSKNNQINSKLIKLASSVVKFIDETDKQKAGSGNNASK